MNIRIVCLLLALSFNANANAAVVQSRHDLSKLRQVEALLKTITEKVASERAEETALYEEISHYCEVRQHRARPGVVSAPVVPQIAFPKVEVPQAPEAAPLEAVAAEAAPVVAAPVESASAKAAPVEAAPAEASPVEAAPVESASVEAAPVEAAPVEAAPVEAAPAEAAPMEAAPVEAAQVEAAPVETASVEAAPQEAAPVEMAPADAAPVEVAPMEAASMEAAPAEAAPVEAPPAETDPIPQSQEVEPSQDGGEASLKPHEASPREIYESVDDEATHQKYGELTSSAEEAYDKMMSEEAHAQQVAKELQSVTGENPLATDEHPQVEAASHEDERPLVRKGSSAEVTVQRTQTPVPLRAVHLEEVPVAQGVKQQTQDLPGLQSKRANKRVTEQEAMKEALQDMVSDATDSSVQDGSKKVLQKASLDTDPEKELEKMQAMMDATNDISNTPRSPVVTTPARQKVEVRPASHEETKAVDLPDISADSDPEKDLQHLRTMLSASNDATSAPSTVVKANPASHDKSLPEATPARQEETPPQVQSEESPEPDPEKQMQALRGMLADDDQSEELLKAGSAPVKEMPVKALPKAEPKVVETKPARQKEAQPQEVSAKQKDVTPAPQVVKSLPAVHVKSQVSTDSPEVSDDQYDEAAEDQQRELQEMRAMDSEGDSEYVDKMSHEHDAEAWRQGHAKIMQTAKAASHKVAAPTPSANHSKARPQGHSKIVQTAKLASHKVAAPTPSAHHAKARPQGHAKVMQTAKAHHSEARPQGHSKIMQTAKVASHKVAAPISTTQHLREKRTAPVREQVPVQKTPAPAPLSEPIAPKKVANAEADAAAAKKMEAEAELKAELSEADAIAAAAATRAAATVVSSTKPVTIRGPKLATTRRMAPQYAPKVSSEIAQEFKQMNDLLSFAPITQPQVSVEPAKVEVPTVKPDTHADSLVAESDELESVIAREEDTLKTTSGQEGQRLLNGSEAALRKDLQAYVTSTNPDDNVMPEEFIDDSGIVKFDAQASSAVVLQEDEALLKPKPVKQQKAVEAVLKLPPKPVKQQKAEVKAAVKVAPVKPREVQKLKATVKVAPVKPKEVPKLPAVRAPVQSLQSVQSVVTMLPADDEDPADGDVAQVERDLLPVAAVAEVPKTQAKADELSLTSQSEDALFTDLGSKALDDLAGAIPNIEKEALQLYTANGGEPGPLEALNPSNGGLPAASMFLQMRQRTQHTPGIPSQVDLDAAWDALRQVAHETQGAMSMVQHMKTIDEARKRAHAVASKPLLGLIQSGNDDLQEADVDDECEWLLTNFKHRQQMRANEADLLAEAHRLLGTAHVFIQEPRRLRGQR